MPNFLKLFKGKRITVMGLGLLGRGLGDTLFIARCGARITVTDLKTAEQLAPAVEKLKGLDITLKLGGHDPNDFIHTDMILRNADVPRSSRFLQIAQEHGIPVEMDESLFCKHFLGRVVGVTGTRGKTTTTMLVHNILSSHGITTFLAGNIMGRATLPLLEQAGSSDTVVLELSSWQLQGFHDAKLSPHAAIFTNIYPDHLNRYSGMDEYIYDKKSIYLYQKNHDFCIFNADQQETSDLAQEAPANTGFFSAKDVPTEWSVKLLGRHNRENVAAASALTRRMQVPEETIRSAVESFKGIEHRLQWLGAKNGVAFVNDSTSTTPVAGMAALEAIDAERILLIAGGADKNLNLTAFAAAASEKAERIALIDGTATDGLYQEIVKHGGSDKIVGRFNDLEKAVLALFDQARSGDVILLSPGCASFGMFVNEFNRGDRFIKIVDSIIDM